MKQSEAKEFLFLIQEWAEGKTLQRKIHSTGQWVDVSDDDGVAFTADPSHYRIKPEPRTFYAVEYSDGSIGFVCYSKEERDDFYNRGWGKPITLMEVLDD